MNPDQIARPIELAAGDVLTTSLATAVRFPSGHHSRGVSCLICGQALGSFPVDQVCLWPADGQGCSCGRVDVVAFLVHAHHELPPVGRLVRLVRARLATEHPAEQVNL